MKISKISLFSFRFNGLNSNYFCGELSHVSVLLAILCLSDFTTSAIIQLLLLRANISRGTIGNQHDITSFEMGILFSLRLNGHKSNYFCGESSYVSVLLAVLCLSVLPQALLYSFYCYVLMFRVCGNQHNKFIAKI